MLNDALQLDPEAITYLMDARVPCNDAMGQHPTIQVGCQGGECRVGLLGVLNGLFGLDDQTGWGAIVAEMDGERVTRFVLSTQASELMMLETAEDHP